ncbi:MAG: trypsin-like peptidase domain-containing protein [Phycisphaerae bacterium]
MRTLRPFRPLVLAAVAAAGVFLVTAAPVLAAEAGSPTAAAVDRRTPVVRAVERAAPSVVNLSTEQVRVVRPFFGFDLPDVFRREFGDLFRPRRYVSGSLGSGAVISPRGYIVTNAHVVQRAEKIIVTLADESQHEADLVSADPEADLAIIKIETDRPLTAIPLGTSADLMIGETVIAVGNPFGYQHSVTTGVVSALDRTLEPGQGVRYEGLIQTDAPINPGNSGGPLLNIRGELIGINTAIRAGAQGLGFAIPVDEVREIMVGLLNLRRPGSPWLGATFRTDTPGRAVVEAVEPDSPAEKAGLKPGDRIVRLDGKAPANAIELETMLLEREAGREVRLALQRDGRRLEKTVHLAAAPKPDGEQLARKRFGLHLQELDPDLAATMRLWADRGLLVAGTDPGSPAREAGLRSGDVIVQVDRYRVTDLDTLGTLLATVETGDRIRFYVVRRRTLAQVVLEAQ